MPNISLMERGEFVVDGGIVWVLKDKISEAPTWTSYTQYRLGDTVNVEGADASLFNYSLESLTNYGYDIVFSRMLECSGRKGDVVVGISTSGNSSNIIKAYEVAKQKGIHIISFTGATGGNMKEYSDILINVPSTDTPRIQESHIMIGHIICELVESNIFPK